MQSQFVNISAVQQDDVLVVTMQCDQITQYEHAESMAKELLSAWEQSTAVNVVVDFSAMTFMSSVGYGPLISLRKRVDSRGGRLVFCCLSDDLREMFTTTRLLINPRAEGFGFESAESLDGAIKQLAE